MRWGFLGFGLLVAVIGVMIAFAGPLQTCGADQVAVCVAWPRAVSVGLWTSTIALVVLLVAWQVRQR
jgi:hypothetical protein